MEQKFYYKAFNKDLTCHGFQYQIGQTYSHDGDVTICESGFHSCENPMDVLNYYHVTSSRFAKVTIDGQISKKDNGDSKVSSQKITICEELDVHNFINECVNYLLQNGFTDLVASGYYSQLAASGDGSKLAASGYYSQLAASGNDSKLVASGYGSQLVSSGNTSQLAASGIGSQLAASGIGSKLSASGNVSQLAASGYNSKLAASGIGSKLAASGNDSELSASGAKSIISAIGENSKAKLDHPGPIALSWYDKQNDVYRISVGQVGEDLKPGIWYKLDENGNFVEC